MNDKRKVKCSFANVDGNAYMLMGYFQQQARKQGFSDDWIRSVLNEAMSSDYNNLVATLLLHSEE